MGDIRDDRHIDTNTPHQKIMSNLLASKFAAIASEIDNTTAQITALQNKLSQLQEFQQQLLSVEQACQSVLSQADTALMMLHHIDPSQIEVLRDALLAKFEPTAIAQIEPATDAPDTAPDTAPTPPDTDPVIDVESVPDTAPAPTAPATDIEKSLDSLSLKSFRKLAKSKGLDARLNRVTLTARLKALVTRGEVLAVS